MAVEFPNSVFIHIPKCGGRWAKETLNKYVKGYSTIGDPIYDSHSFPDTDKPVFCIVREPAMFAHSLWHHRARKKSNKHGHAFNWQEYLRLENECQSEDYDTFMENVANCKNGVHEYFQHYIAKYETVYCARLEKLGKELCHILESLGEEFDRPGIFYATRTIIGKGTATTEVDEDIRLRINRANKDFCESFEYPL
jgi:hypothetical protein